MHVHQSVLSHTFPHGQVAAKMHFCTWFSTDFTTFRGKLYEGQARLWQVEAVGPGLLQGLPEAQVAVGDLRAAQGPAGVVPPAADFGGLELRAITIW